MRKIGAMAKEKCAAVSEFFREYWNPKASVRMVSFETYCKALGAMAHSLPRGSFRPHWKMEFR
jgi:hypothetical protein